MTRNEVDKAFTEQLIKENQELKEEIIMSDNKKEFMEFMNSIYDSIYNTMKCEISGPIDFVRNNLQCIKLDETTRIWFLIVNRQKSNIIAQWTQGDYKNDK